MKKLLVALYLGVAWLSACSGGTNVPVGETGPTAVPEAASQEEANQVGEDGSAGEAGEGDAGVDATGAENAYSGIDPETGLEVNPANVAPGLEFIVRGQIISVNLTPQDEPEFVLKAPSGQHYRMGAQPLTEIFYEDGKTQLKPHEYRNGMEAQATVTYPADAGPTDILVTRNFTLIGPDNGD